MTKNNKCLFISLAVSLVLIIVGVVMFSVLGGFNDDGFTKDKTVITVTGDPIVTVREDFRNDLDELCKTTLEDAGAKVGGGRYLETTDKGTFEYTLNGSYDEATLETYVKALETAISTQKAGETDKTFGETSFIYVAQHRQNNLDYYKYMWTFAIAACSRSHTLPSVSISAWASRWALLACTTFCSRLRSLRSFASPRASVSRRSGRSLCCSRYS